jgi:hypothetical protein
LWKDRKQYYNGAHILIFDVLGERYTMKHTYIKSLMLTTSLTLAACGSGLEATDPNPKPHDAPDGPGLFSGKTGNLLDSFDNKDSSNASIGVDPYLWRASLEAVSFMPIYQADSAGGVILTDWYTSPNNSEEQFKVNIMLLGKELSPSALNVSVFKKGKTASGWTDLGSQEATAKELEETILTNARSFRVRAKASQ